MSLPHKHNRRSLLMLRGTRKPHEPANAASPALAPAPPPTTGKNEPRLMTEGAIKVEAVGRRGHRFTKKGGGGHGGLAQGTSEAQSDRAKSSQLCVTFNGGH